MATITINIPVDKEQWVLDGLALAYDYQENIENPLFDGEIPEDPIGNPRNIPNPESKAVFTRNKIVEYIKGVVKAYGADVVAANETLVDAKTAAADTVDADIT